MPHTPVQMGDQNFFHESKYINLFCYFYSVIFENQWSHVYFSFTS